MPSIEAIAKLPVYIIRDIYIKTKAQIKLLEDIADTLNAAIKSYMGEETEMSAGEGWTFKIDHRVIRTYDKAVLRKYLDESTLDEVLKPDNAKVKSVLEKMDLTKAALEEIESTMVVVSESKALRLVTPKKGA